MTNDESNFLRFSHLIQKIAPQAVRCRFDNEFPPTDLDRKIRQNLTLLMELHQKRVLTKQQWNLINLPRGNIFYVMTMSALYTLRLHISLKKSLFHENVTSQKYDILVFGMILY